MTHKSKEMDLRNAHVHLSSPFGRLDLASAILYSMEITGRNGEICGTLFRDSNSWI
jgi:hypothetical protein